MAKTHFSAYPPYEGAEPYVYLCFHDGDAPKVKALLALLWARGCRVWYAMGKTADAGASRRRAERIQGASLMLLYLSPLAARDETIKSTLGYYQSGGGPVASLETQAIPPESGLGFLFGPQVVHIPAYEYATTEALVSALIRTPGFSQDLLGAPRGKDAAVVRRTALMLLAASLAILLGTFLYARSRNYFRPEAPAVVDTVTVADDALRQAARMALSPTGDAALTEAGLASITTLRLYAPPESYDELALFPALERLEIPQSCVRQAAELLSAAYTIVVYGEAGA